MWNPWKVWPPMTSNALKTVLWITFFVTFNQKTKNPQLCTNCVHDTQCVKMRQNLSIFLAYRTHDTQYHACDASQLCPWWRTRNPIAFVFLCHFPPVFAIFSNSLHLMNLRYSLALLLHFYLIFIKVTPNTREKHVMTGCHHPY